VAPGVPEGLRAIVRDCLMTERKKRIGTFDEIVDRLIAVLPILEQSGQRLPSPVIVGPPSDPDATNALPVMRASDHIGGSSAGQQAGVHVSIPATPKSPSITPNGHFTSYEDRGAMTVIRPPPVALFIGLGIGIACVALAIVAFVARGIGIAREVASDPAPFVAPVPHPAAALPAPVATATPPLVNLDSLPVSSARAQNPVRGMGFIGIAASPGTCSVAIDGSARGWTPLSALKLPIGTHEVQCFPPSGKAHSMTVTIEEGVISKFRFDLSDGH